MDCEGFPRSSARHSGRDIAASIRYPRASPLQIAQARRASRHTRSGRLGAVAE